MISHLFAGKTQREAAELVSVDEKTVGRWLQEPAIRQEFATQLSAISTEVWAHVAAEVGEVWEVFMGLLRSDDERIRLRACEYFLDRILSVLPIERLVEEARLAGTPTPPGLARWLEEPSDRSGGEVA